MTAPINLLPDRDREYLETKGLPYSLHVNNGEVHLTFPSFEMPGLYNITQADLRVILPVGYDNACPDMFWTRPNVMLRTGGFQRAADNMQELFDGTWQRWSRHFEGGWRPGVDGIKTYLASVRRALEQVA